MALLSPGLSSRLHCDPLNPRPTVAPRILLAALYHETHTFLPQTTGWSDIVLRRGHEVLARRGDASTVDGFLSVAERLGWQVVPTLDMSAMPSGTIEQDVLDRYWMELEPLVRNALREGLDGIWLGLHGAMVTTGCLDPEGWLLARLRALPGAGTLPLFALLDLHATITDTMARHADGLVAYRENPHIDAFAAAERAAMLLARSLATGERPRTLTRRLPIVWPPTGTGTADEPMRSLGAMAREIEAVDRDVWAVNIVGGFAFADTPDTGVSVSIVTTGPEGPARAHLARLADRARELRQHGVPDEWDLDAAIRDALARGLARGPWLMVEPADNIGGGAPGDCTSILRAFLAHGLEGAAVVINDPASVGALAGTALGARASVAIGGWATPADPGPLTLDVELLGRSDGRFTLEDRNSHLASIQGIHADMGPCATVRVGGVTILLTSRKTPPFDLGQLRSQGIAPEALRFAGIKAAVAHRRAWEPIAAGSYRVRTPGACPSDLQRLTYRQIRRPIYPLDPD
jgi:microcystin degradation protein MlrC